MRIILDIKDKPAKGDILVFDGEEYKAVAGYKFLNEVKQEQLDIRQEFDTLKKSINDKLKEYHDILQLISKEE